MLSTLQFGAMAAKAFKSKNAARRAAKKEKKANGGVTEDNDTRSSTEALQESIVRPEDADAQTPNVKEEPSQSILDYIANGLQDDPALEEFKAIFNRFQTVDTDSTSHVRLIHSGDKGEVFFDDDDNIPEESNMLSEDEDEDNNGLSRTKLKKRNRLNVAELKQLVKKPEVVEWTDVSAPDPKLLVSLKSLRNCVPVPAHWSQKRDYLSGKRGVEKSSFELPDFIRATGVGEMRQAAADQREAQSLKQQMRQRVQPKMGRLDIDYQKLHDAFFRFQTKPVMTKYGETYFEGKEYETNTREKRPGDLSEDLKDALNIPPGAPPPWLISMQRFGPPPSYPSLKISGLNAPIPSGAQWGFHPGGWGKPPTDEYNRPLYGDVFGIVQPSTNQGHGEKKETEIWGGLEEAEESEEEDEEEDEEEENEEEAQAEGHASNREESSDNFVNGIQSQLPGTASVAPSGWDTPDHIELRKSREDDVNRPKTLYQVLPERQQNIKGFYGSSHAYTVPTQSAPEKAVLPTLGAETRKRNNDDVNLAIDPDNLAGMTTEELNTHYDRARAEKSGKPSTWDQDLSDMVSEQASQAAKRQKLRANPDKKKEKFKF